MSLLGGMWMCCERLVTCGAVRVKCGHDDGVLRATLTGLATILRA